MVDLFMMNGFEFHNPDIIYNFKKVIPLIIKGADFLQIDRKPVNVVFFANEEFNYSFFAF